MSAKMNEGRKDVVAVVVVSYATVPPMVMPHRDLLLLTLIMVTLDRGVRVKQ